MALNVTSDTEIKTTAETEGKNLLGKAVNVIQDLVMPQSDAYSTQIGLQGSTHIYNLPSTLSGMFVDTKKIKQEIKSHEADWTPHTIQSLFESDTPVTNLDIIDVAGNTLYKGEEIPPPSDTSIHKFHMAQNTYKKIKNNEPVNSADLNFLKSFKADIARINEEAQLVKDKVFIHGMTDEGNLTEEIRNAGFLWFNPERGLAENRKQLDNFVSDVMVGKNGEKGGEANNLLLRRFLRDNFQTANPLLEASRRTADFTMGATEFLFPLRWAIGDDMLRAAKNATSLEDFWIKFEAGKDNRMQLKNAYMKNFENSGFALDRTLAFNNWIKERWLEENDIKDWENVREELTLEPEQVRQLTDFSTKEMGWLATIQAFALENTIASWGLVTGGKGLRHLFTFGKSSNAKEFLKLENKKLSYAGKDGVPVFTASSVGDFATFLAKQEGHRTNVFNMWWKMLSWPQARQLSRLESGRIRVGQINNSISPWARHKTVKDELEDARKELVNLIGNPNKLSPNDFKTQMAQAEKKLDKVTDHYIVELHKVGGTSWLMTAPQMKRILGDEVTPAVAQGLVYTWFEDTENAEMAGALANITTALGFHRGLIRGGDAIIDIIPGVGEGVFNLKGWLDDTLTNPYLSKLGFKGFLDADIKNLQIDGAPLTRTEYNSMVQFQNRMRQLGPEVVEFLDGQHAIVKKQYESILKTIPDNHPDKAAIAENLRLSFAQMSQITYFAALGRKLSMQINHNDITKMNPRFQESLQTWMKEQKLIHAQSAVLDNLSAILSAQAPEAYGGSVRLTDFISKQRDALKATTVGLDHQKDMLNKQYDLIMQWVENPDNWKMVSSKELDNILESTFDAEEILNPDLIPDVKRVAFPEQVTDAVAQTVARLSNNRVSVVDALNAGIQKLDETKLHSFDDKTVQLGVLKDLAKATATNYQIQKIITARRMDKIYKPLDNIVNDIGQPIEIPSHTLFHRVLAHDLNSVGDQNLLARFAKNSSFSRSTEGKAFFKASNQSSRRALVKHMLFDDINSKTINSKIIDSINVKLERDGLAPIDLNTPYENLPPKLLWNEAGLMVDKMIAKDIHKINKKWQKDVGTEPSYLQSYMYYVDKLKSSERPMAEIGLTLRELEDFRTYARDRTFFLQTRDPSNVSISGWMDMDNTINAAIEKGAPDITITLPNGSTTDGLSYLQWTRTTYELEVANRRIPNSFYDAYIKALNADPYAPTRIRGERGTVTIDGEEVEFDIPKFKDDQTMLNTALGQQFLKNVFSKKSTTVSKAKDLESFQEGVLRQWGEVKYPAWASLEGKGGTYADLNPEIFSLESIKKLPEYDDWVASFRASPEISEGPARDRELLSFLTGKMKNKLRTETDYIIDLDTEAGKEAMKLVENTYGILINELRHSTNIYGQLLTENNINQVIKAKDIKYFGAADKNFNMNSFLTERKGGLEQFKVAQELLMLPVIKDGVTTTHMVKNLDVIMASETNIRNFLRTNVKAQKFYNIEIQKLNHKVNQGKILSRSQQDLQDEWREGYLKFLDIQRSDELVEKVFGGEQRRPDHDWLAAKQELEVYTTRLIQNEKIKMKNQFDTMKKNGVLKADGSGWRKPTKQELKTAEWWADDKNIENEINRSMRSFLWEGVRSYSGVVTKPVKGMDNKVVNTQTMANPEVALEMLERPEVKEIFKGYGVDDSHYDAMLAITGHQVIMKRYYDLSTGGMSINDPRLTDTGIISRAFNYSRGLVSKEYLAVEAGFRVMRDRNLRVMNWLMNDKEAAELIHQMMTKPDSFEDWQAQTLYERMSSYIVRELGHRGETLSTYEDEIANHMETIEDERTVGVNTFTAGSSTRLPASIRKSHPYAAEIASGQFSISG